MVHDSQAIGDLSDPPFIRDRYPGLRQTESDLLRAYLFETGTDDIRRLRTQVEVGPGEDVPSLESNFREMAFRLSRLKADAIINYPSRTDIIELKSRATHHSLGQAVAYGFFLGKIAHERSTPRLIVVAFREHPAAREFARALGAQIHIIPHADPSNASRPGELAESIHDLRGRIAE